MGKREPNVNKMQKKTIIIICSIAAIAIATACVLIFFSGDNAKNEDQPFDPNNTNTNIKFDDGTPPADSAIVGKWHSTDKPGWYKVYLDDYDDDGYYWGKEWDESEDVYETDLTYHGNGWFRWRRDGKQLTEIHLMSIKSEVPITKTWNVSTYPPTDRKQRHKFFRGRKQKDSNQIDFTQVTDSLILTEPDFAKRVRRFARVSD